MVVKQWHVAVVGAEAAQLPLEPAISRSSSSIRRRLACSVPCQGSGIASREAAPAP